MMVGLYYIFIFSLSILRGSKLFLFFLLYNSVKMSEPIVIDDADITAGDHGKAQNSSKANK